MRIAEMHWRQVEDYLKGDDRAILPLGCVEQHAYLSLATDAILAERVAVEAAEPLGIPVFPALAYGITPLFLAYPGTVSLRAGTYLAVLRDMLDSLAGQGFRRIVLVNGHGGNSPAGWGRRHPVPGKVLHPGGVRGERIDLLDCLPGLRRIPPIVQDDTRAGVIAHPLGGERAGGRVPTMPIDEHDAPEPLAGQRVKHVAQHCQVGGDT